MSNDTSSIESNPLIVPPKDILVVTTPFVPYDIA